MLIHSKFRDYYDNCAAYGVDTQVRYERETEVFSHSDYSDNGTYTDPSPKIKAVMAAAEGWGRPLSWLDNLDWRETGNRISIGVFGFCGVLHRFVSYRREVQRDDRLYPTTEEVVHFDASTMPPEWKDKYRYWKTGTTLFQDFEKPLSRDNVDTFILLNAPIFVAYNDRVRTNPNLKELGFSKFKDGVSVFQEISAFISGTLNTVNQMKHVASDQEKIQAHGFDKHSFRKGKTK